MKLNKLISFVLVCVMLISAFAINTFAADGEDAAPAKIVSENVYYGDTLKLMFAVAADDGVDYDLVVTDADGNNIPVSPFYLDGNRLVVNDGLAYIANVGVPAQNIADEVTVQVVVDGEVVDEKIYSVLEYLYTRLYINANSEDEKKRPSATQIAKYEALIAFADAADIAINGAKASESVANYKFLNVVGANVEGADNTGIYMTGTAVTLTTDLVAGDGESVVWNVTNFDKDTTVQYDDNEGTLDITVDANIQVEPAIIEGDGPVEVPKEWTLVTDVSDLEAGAQIIIAAKNANVALSTTQNSNNRKTATISKSGSILVNVGSDVQIITLEAGKTSGTFAFNVGTGYLYAASSSNNYLRTEKTLSANSSWSITITSAGVATVKSTGTYTRNLMKYNSSSSLFSCYSSGQQDICIYMYK